MEEESSFVGSGETRDELYKSIKSYSKVLNSLFGHSEESKPKLMLCRKRLIIECVKLLFTDPDFFLEKNIFQLLWKEGFHIFIERYRKLITAEDDSNREEYDRFIKSSISTLQDFYEKIFQEQCVDDANRTEESKLFFSIVTKQRCLFTILIYLGDLERYPVSQRMTFV